MVNLLSYKTKTWTPYKHTSNTVPSFLLYVSAEYLQLQRVHNIQITNKIHFNVCDIFYSKCSYQHVSAATVVIFSVMLLQK